MHIKVKDHLVELLEAEDHHPDNRGGLIIALGILLLAFGVSAAMFAVIL